MQGLEFPMWNITLNMAPHSWSGETLSQSRGQLKLYDMGAHVDIGPKPWTACSDRDRIWASNPKIILERKQNKLAMDG